MSSDKIVIFLLLHDDPWTSRQSKLYSDVVWKINLFIKNSNLSSKEAENIKHKSNSKIKLCVSSSIHTIILRTTTGNFNLDFEYWTKNTKDMSKSEKSG